MDTFNIYMDEVVAGVDSNNEEVTDIEFRVMPSSQDTGNPQTDAVLANLDLFDVIGLRDALQDMIDEIALIVFDIDEEDGEGEEEAS